MPRNGQTETDFSDYARTAQLIGRARAIRTWIMKVNLDDCSRGKRLEHDGYLLAAQIEIEHMIRALKDQHGDWPDELNTLLIRTGVTDVQ